LVKLVLPLRRAVSMSTYSLAAHWGISKVGSKVSERISVMVMSANVARTKSGAKIFLWKPDVSPGHFRIFRVPECDEASKRGADDLPTEEIANTALHILENQISLPTNDLINETARIFGFARTGQAVASSMRIGIETLLKRGDAFIQNGTVACSR